MHAVSEIDAAERRRESRERLHLDGSIVFNDGKSIRDCLIPDWSAIGARIIVTDAASVPDRFVLVVDRLGWRADAMVKRREGGVLGVTFTDFKA